MQVSEYGKSLSWSCDDVPVRQDEHDKKSDVGVDTCYNPVFLRRWVLASFATLWIFLLAGLQLLYITSSNQNGLATTEESLKYLWTYGPTAVFVTITVGWRQVDYTAKYVQPWAEMAGGPAPASRTLLLDYVTPFQLVSLSKAIRYGHVSVVSTILISILIKLSTIVSTGLLGVELLLYEDAVNITMKAGLDSTGFDLAHIDSRSTSSVYAYSMLGVPMPSGTTEKYAYPVFNSTADQPPNIISYNAAVDVFVPTANCEAGRLTHTNGMNFQPAGDGFNPEKLPVASYYNTSVEVPDCTIHYGHLDAPDWYFLRDDTTPRYGYWGAAQLVNCSNLPSTHPSFHRFMVSVAYSRGDGQNNNTMLNSSNVVCRPSYSIHKGYVSLYKNGTVNGDILLSDRSNQLFGFDGTVLGLATYKSVALSSISSSISRPSLTSDNWLNLMVLSDGDNFALESLMNSSWLSSRWKSVYMRTAVQVARLHLMNTTFSSNDTEGTLTAPKLRLVVRSVPARLLQVIAGVMLLLTILLILTAPQSVVPNSIDSIAGIAAVLARSPALANILRDTGHLDLPHLQDVLSGQRYQCSVRVKDTGRSFVINVHQSSASTRSYEHSLQIDWTRPTVLRRAIMVLGLMLASAVLVAIELLYEYSVVHNGITYVDHDSFQRYVWLYVPTVVLVLIASMFNALNFEVEVADTYHKLAQGYTEARTTLFWHPPRNFRIVTVCEALRHSRFALVASSISVLIAPLLAVAASGLLLPQVLTDSAIVATPVESWFNASASKYADLNTVIPSMVLQANMTYPEGTWGELALAQLKFNESGLSATAGAFNAVIPALRSRVGCEEVASQAINNLTISQRDSVRQSTTPSLYINATVPARCSAPLPDQHNSTWYYYGRVKISVNTTGYFGTWISGSYSLNATETKAQSLVCPDMYAAFGYIDLDNNITDFTLQRCVLGLESLTVNATIDVETGGFLQEPIIVPGSIRHFSDTPVFSGSAAAAGPYFLETKIDKANAAFDPFFAVMIHGKDGIPASELLNSKTLVAQITHTFRQWSAQVINVSLRSQLSALTNNQTLPPSSIPGTYTHQSRQRLTLTPISTRLLEAVLLTLIFCGLTVFCLFDMSRVLPKPIGTIGAVASLLADSQLIDEKSGLIPPGFEWLGDKERMKTNVWSAVRFRMGWWDRTDTRSRDGTAETDQEGEKSKWFGIDARLVGEIAVRTRQDSRQNSRLRRSVASTTQDQNT